MSVVVSAAYGAFGRWLEVPSPVQLNAIGAAVVKLWKFLSTLRLRGSEGDIQRLKVRFCRGIELSGNLHNSRWASMRSLEVTAVQVCYEGHELDTTVPRSNS